MPGEAQQHYMEVLGVRPGATLEEIRTAYYTQLERISDNPTEDEADEQIRIRHAYAVLCRSYETGGPARVREAMWRDPWPWLRIAALALAVAVPLLVLINLSWIRMSLTHHEPGTLLRVKHRNAPYGTVLRYEPDHRFHTGTPTPAYEIRLAGGEETVWVSARVVGKGMVAVENTGR